MNIATQTQSITRTHMAVALLFLGGAALAAAGAGFQSAKTQNAPSINGVVVQGETFDTYSSRFAYRRARTSRSSGIDFKILSVNDGDTVQLTVYAGGVAGSSLNFGYGWYTHPPGQVTAQTSLNFQALITLNKQWVSAASPAILQIPVSAELIEAQTGTTFNGYADLVIFVKNDDGVSAAGVFEDDMTVVRVEIAEIYQELPIGQACEGNEDCPAPLGCSPEEHVCADAQFALPDAEGASCNPKDGCYGDDLWCDSQTKLCGQQACEGNADCAAGAQCDPNEHVCVANTYFALPDAEGASCNPKDGCYGGLICDEETKLCVEQVLTEIDEDQQNKNGE